MSTAEIVEQIKSLPRDEQWEVFRLLSHQLQPVDDARLAEEFAIIGSDAAGSDVEFAVAAQSEVLKHG